MFAEKSSALFGEILPNGVQTMLNIMTGQSARILVDAGAGLGRLALQSFLTCPNLDVVIAIELCPSRYVMACDILRKFQHLNRTRFGWWESFNSGVVQLMLRDPDGRQRVLELRHDNLFNRLQDIVVADLVILETNFPKEQHGKLSAVLARSIKPGARVLLYHSVEKYV
jgi:hypothetical protein